MSKSDRLTEKEVSQETMSKSDRLTEKEVVLRVLDAVKHIADQHSDEGMGRRNFSLGVLNCFLLMYTFGRFPQHFWILYSLELLFLLPLRIYDSCTRKPSRVLYYLDFCWMINFLFILYFMAMLFGLTLMQAPAFRFHVFLTWKGIATGPLLLATIVLPFVSLLFHDYKIMTGTFIHIMPTALVYTAMWYSHEIRQAWPNIVDLTFLEDVKFLPEGKFFIMPGTHLGTVAGNALFAYLLWFTPYVLWQTFVGMDLPRKNRLTKDGHPIEPKYDTVFHSTVRKGLCIKIGKLWGRPVSVSKQQMKDDDYELRDFLVYMACHATGIYLSVFLLGYPCYLSRTFHALVLILQTVLVVTRGSQRYAYYVTHMYGKIIRKDFADELATKEKES